MSDARAYVLEAELVLDAQAEPAAVGATVTAGLCGHWTHEGPCRWPHNNAIDAKREPATFRTLFVADPSEEPLVRGRIDERLRIAEDWTVVGIRERPVSEGERPLAEKLLGGPRAPAPLE